MNDKSWGTTFPNVVNQESPRTVFAERLFRDGFNCAQSVFLAYAEDFGLDRETAAKISCGLGGGVGRMREVCGAVTGASLVLGLRHGEDKAVVYPHVQEFCRRFKEEVGSIVCHELLATTIGVVVPQSGDPQSSPPVEATLGDDVSKRRQERTANVSTATTIGVVVPQVGGAPEARTDAYYKKRPCVELVKLAVRLLEEPAG